ncbi:MAG: radical SAM/SPASM domain-containing protein [Candidatus Omnitrophota bacterium]|nr:radical SAM/SPASM domain-containing protein [Candidatus Omnitrophota bacterium]
MGSTPARNSYHRLKAKLFLTGMLSGKITVRKLWNVLLCTAAYLLKTKRSASSPFILSLELWNECNAGCLFCRDKKGTIYNLNPNNPTLGSISKGKMPAEMAMDIIDQVKKDVLIAVLYTNGEPLLYKDLGKVIRFATERKVMTMISTNGLLFTEQNAREILAAGLDFIKIQLGGFTQDIYSIQIRYGEVEKLKENIRMVARIKKELNTPALIMIDWITYNYNRHQIPLIRQFCQELGVMLSFRQGNPRGGLEGKETALPTTTLPISCDWLWKAMQVNFNGDMLQCCEGVVWSNLKPYATYKAGDRNVREIWNGPAAIATRELMATKGRKSMPICSQCQRSGVAFKW